MNLSYDNTGITLDVHNTGTVITQDDQQLLFRRFWQGGPGRSYVAGTGLGLYLCRQIVEAHEGKIWCLSDFEIGTTFSFTIPFAPARTESSQEIYDV